MPVSHALRDADTAVTELRASIAVQDWTAVACNYDVDAGWILIPDRVRSYVVECGIVTRQTTHGLIDIVGPPP